jgi:formate-dependent nitrite reductase membrane component NrfD
MASPTDIDTLLAKAQVAIVLLFSVGFFSVLFFLMVYHKEMTPTEVTILTGLLSSLATIIALQQNFMFARTRPAALPDPTTTSTTTTTTTTPAPLVVPPGSTIVHAPAPPAAIVTDPLAKPQPEPPK